MILLLRNHEELNLLIQLNSKIVFLNSTTLGIESKTRIFIQYNKQGQI